MRYLIVVSLLALCCWSACSPKTGEKTAQPVAQPAPSAGANAAPVGKAPVIPIPEGDVRKTAPKAGQAPKIQVGKAETFQLENGLKVIVVENHKLPKVSYRLFVDYDPVLEREAAGYIDLMAEIWATGTESRTKAQIDEAVDFLGASLYSDPNGLSGACLSKHADKLLEIMSDVLLRPKFAPAELEKAKRQMESNLAAAQSEPDAIAQNVGAVLNYGKDHPYGELPTEQMLEKITLEKIKAHYQTFIKPDVAYLVIVGDVTREKAEKQAKKYFGPWKKGTVPTQKYFAPRAPEKTQFAFVHKPGAVQSLIRITYPVDLKPNAPDAIKARLLSAVLGGGFVSSRLNAKLRETKGWTYGAGASLTPDKLIGRFTTSASVRNSVTDSAIVEFLYEINRLRTEKLRKEELQTVKNIMVGQFSRSLEEPGTVAQFALNTARYGLPADYYENYLTALQAISAEELLYTAKKYLTPDNAHILVVGNRDEVAEKVKKMAPDGNLRFYDHYGNPVKPVNAALPSGLSAEQVVEAYLSAIGGREKIAAIQDMVTTNTMFVGGSSFDLKTTQKDGDKIVVEASSAGQLINKKVFDGAQGFIMGGSPNAKPQAVEGEELADLKEQAAWCKEALYAKNAYRLSLKGTTNIEGAEVYLVEVTRPDGKVSKQYYDTKTGLKLREESTLPSATGLLEQTADFSNYREVGGVKLPHTVILTGLLPTPIQMSVKEISVNQGVSADVFKR